MRRIKQFFGSLYGQLSLLILLLVSTLGCVLMFLSQNAAERNRMEVMQGVNQSTAMYITQQYPLITSGGVNEEKVTELANRAMVVNPSLEIYVLDSNGKVLSHRLPQGAVVSDRVDTQPLNAFMRIGLLDEKGNGNAELPIYGDDPRRPNQKSVFSVSPIESDGRTLGYVYAVIGGEVYQSLHQKLSESTYQTLFFWVAALAILCAGVIGMLLVFFITNPVRQLGMKMQVYRPGSAPVDITHYKNNNEISVLMRHFNDLQQTINQQLDAIQQLDQTRRELIANVSHDLRTPLAALQGTLELLILRRDKLSEPQKLEQVKSAFKQSRRLTRLVDDLFELSKLESGGMDLRLEHFSVSELLQDCSHDLSQLASQHGVSVKLAIQPNVNPIVHADISLIQRVLENLISNAIRNTAKGGVITLSVEESGAGTRVAVADTGVGISSAELPHIFDRFYQCKATEHSSQIGSGLGLAIVKRILAIHNATINVTSRLNVGTKFEFELSTQ